MTRPLAYADHDLGYNKPACWDHAVDTPMPIPPSSNVLPSHINRAHARRNPTYYQDLERKLLAARLRAVPPTHAFAPQSNWLCCSAQPQPTLHASVWLDADHDCWRLIAHDPTTGKHIDRTTQSREEIRAWWAEVMVWM